MRSLCIYLCDNRPSARMSARAFSIDAFSLRDVCERYSSHTNV